MIPLDEVAAHLRTLLAAHREAYAAGQAATDIANGFAAECDRLDHEIYAARAELQRLAEEPDHVV